MIGKKFLTLACAAGILATGACFLPPLPEHHPTSPPPLIDLAGIKTIRVEVLNQATVPHLVPSEVAEGVATRLNNRRRETGARAVVQPGTGNEDAVLSITILSESAAEAGTATQAGTRRWSLRSWVSATLTRRDGKVVGQLTNTPYSTPFIFTEPDAADVWKDPSAHLRFTNMLSNWLVYSLLRG